MRITFISFSSTSASALYPFQMLTGLAVNEGCKLQVLVAKRAYNIGDYREFCKVHNIELQEYETYEHSANAVLMSFFKFGRFRDIVCKVRAFCPDVIYFPFGCVWAPVLYPVLNRIAPIVNTLHDPHPHDESTGIAESIFRVLGAWAMKRVQGIVVLNNKDVEYVKDKYHKPVAVIPHAAFSFYSKLAKNVDVSVIKHQICFVGRIEPYKGLDLLVEAFQKKKTKGIKLVIAGGGSISTETLTRISSNTNIQLINRFISDEEMVDIIENSDFMVLPYLRASQSGVIPMSFALGRTVIATRVGALEEQVKEGTGKLVGLDSECIADAIDTMYATESRIVEMSKRAKEFADNELTWAHSAELLINFVKTIV